MNKVEQETANDSAEESSIDLGNIDLIHFNKNHMVIIAGLKTSVNQNSVKVPYKVDTGSDGTIVPLHIYKSVFPRITNEQLVATKMIVYN